MIDGWKRVLVLAPHTDDGEFGCGGTIARLVEAGVEVRYVAFSIATKSLPEGFPPDTLASEVREATAELGIPESRPHRARLRRAHVPGAPPGHPRAADRASGRSGSRTPSSSRACTTSTRTTRSSPPRACGRSSGRPSSATRSRGTTSTSPTRRTWLSSARTSSARSAALAKYASQQHRRYADPEYIWNLARTHGVNVSRESRRCSRCTAWSASRALRLSRSTAATAPR